MNIQDAFTQFVRSLQATHPIQTVRSYKTGARIFVEQLQAQKILDTQALNRQAIVGYHTWLAEQGYSKSTLTNRLAGLNRFLNWLSIQDLFDLGMADSQKIEASARNLVRRRQKALPKIPERGDDEKVRAASRALPQLRDRALIEFLFSSGCRRAEASGLRVGDLDLDLRSAKVTGKGAKQRTVFFSSLAQELLKAYFQERGGAHRDEPVFCRIRKGCRHTKDAITGETIHHIVSQAADLAGIERHLFTPHAFRHAFAIRVLHETHDLAMVQDLLGHSQPEATRVYATIYPEDLRDAHRKVFK